MICLIKTDGAISQSNFARKYVIKTTSNMADAGNDHSVTRYATMPIR